jgi:dipeptidyl aminopeptidase/acylaminoacyl peptidase
MRIPKAPLVAVVLVALTLAGLGWQHFHRAAVLRPASQSIQPPAAVPDPLTIEAIRSRKYTASKIATEQELGEQGGYRNAIVSYHSDGLKVYALMSTPDGSAPAGGWPVIILDHGYINPVDYRTDGPEYRDFITAFARAGYMVIKPDYRGNGKSEGVPEGGHFSPVYAYDNLNLIASLKQDGRVNPGRIGLFGHSLGGHVALRTIVASPDVKATVFAAGVVGSMNDLFYNWPHSPMPYDQPSAVVQGKKQELVKKYGDPHSNPNFWNSVSAINYVQNITGTVQVNHDESDTVVPKLFSDHLVAALQKAGKPVDYNVYPGDDHQFLQNRSQLLVNVLAFYRQNL